MQQKVSETWRPIVGYEGLYEVSDHGRVRSVPHATKRGMRGGTMRKLRLDPDGYQMVDLFRGYDKETKKVHRLVLEAFVGPCPDGHEACHYPDRDRSNNILGNLRWGTDSENRLDSVKHGTHGTLKFGAGVVARIFDMRRSGSTHRAIAESIGSSKGYVEKVLYGKLRALDGAACQQ